MYNDKKIYVIRCLAIVILWIIGGVWVFGCAEKKVPETSLETVLLDSIVVKEYQGKKLSILCTTGADSSKSAELIEVDNYSLDLNGLVASAQACTYNEVLMFPHYRKVVTIESGEWTETIDFEGVMVSELVGKAGPLSEAKSIVFRARDGYEAIFPLEYILENRIILAYKANGKCLSPEGGYPFILVSERQKGQEWVKWVTEIEVIGY